MNLLRTALLITVAAVAVAIAPAGLAANPTPAWLKALEIRSQALSQQCVDPTLSREAFRVLCGNAGAQYQPTRAELKALDTRGQALNQQCKSPTLSREAFRALCGNVGAQNQPTRAELRALDVRGRTLSHLCDGRDVASVAGYRAVCGSSARLVTLAPPEVPSTSRFNWSDFAIGAGAMLGLVLLSGGIAAAVHYSRRASVRPRTVS